MYIFLINYSLLLIISINYYIIFISLLVVNNQIMVIKKFNKLL